MAEEVKKVDEGLYTVREHDTLQTVAALLYGDPRRYSDILKMNPDPWEGGEQIRIPNKKGRVTIFTDDSVELMLKRMFPNQPVHIFLKLFLKWNNDGDVTRGDVVFVPER